MITVKAVYEYLDSRYPYRLQESYDNSGIMVDCGREVTKAVVSLDVTRDVIRYAASAGAELIVSHHPVIFRPLRQLTHEMPVFALVAHGISAISAHTNYDIAPGGVNDLLATKLDLQNIRPIFSVSEQVQDGLVQKNYIGRVGELSEPLSPGEFADYVMEKLRGRRGVEYVDGGKSIQTVAVGGGACGEFVFECPKNGIDAFVTGEAKHHELLYAAQNGITLIPAGHYATEAVALSGLASALREGFPTLSVEVTTLDDPLQFTMQ